MSLWRVSFAVCCLLIGASLAGCRLLSVAFLHVLCGQRLFVYGVCPLLVLSRALCVVGRVVCCCLVFVVACLLVFDVYRLVWLLCVVCSFYLRCLGCCLFVVERCVLFVVCSMLRVVR